MHIKLLIEPVWNRNTDSPSNTPLLGAPMLLIEPVWNRNMLKAFYSRFEFGTFNRTSMESKPGRLSTMGKSRASFNRTSMESKLHLKSPLRPNTFSF